jgi:HemK-related putative methylase
MVYEPREDSYLLLECLNKEFEKQTEETGVSVEDRNIYMVDVGAGSGIIGFEAAKKGCHVICLDVDPEAVKYMEENKPTDDVKIIESNLFDEVEGLKFDLITFNTPYLPNDEEFHDVAIHGGQEGYETTVKFLKAARYYMYDDSVILMLISSLTKPKMVELFLIEMNYKFEIIATKKEMMEELLVYRITKN